MKRVSLYVNYELGHVAVSDGTRIGIAYKNKEDRFSLVTGARVALLKMVIKPEHYPDTVWQETGYVEFDPFDLAQVVYFMGKRQREQELVDLLVDMWLPINVVITD